MKTCLLALSLLAGGLGVSMAHTRGLLPEAVMAVANDEGNAAAIERFFSCGSPGDEAYADVASGSKAWVRVAVKVLPDADGCVSESLHDSLARALVRSPRVVLPLVNSAPALSAQSVCIPFLPAEEPTAKSLAYLRHEESVLRSVREPSLQVQKKACLEQVQRTRAAIQ